MSLDSERAPGGDREDAREPPSPEDNVRATETIFSEFARRESARTFQLFDEAIVWDARELPMPEMQGVFHGHDGVRGFWRTWFEVWGRIEFVDGPHHRSNGNQVVTWFRCYLLGRGSGLDLPSDFAVVFTFQLGRVVHAALFRGRDDALRAAGLKP